MVLISRGLGSLGPLSKKQTFEQLNLGLLEPLDPSAAG